MDALARQRGGAGAWPGFPGIDIAGIARSMGCASRRIDGYSELVETFDELIPTLAQRREPMLVEISVGT
jgi:benzoylformate decarboxylase